LNKITEASILKEFDLAQKGDAGTYFPPNDGKTIRYNFFLDLEHGYFVTAGSRIYLYADSTRWAVVFEKNGYNNRGTRAEIELDYIGNCIHYPRDTFGTNLYLSNAEYVTLISGDDYDSIKNKVGTDMEKFELISADAKNVAVHGAVVPIEHDTTKYTQLGIAPRDFDNPRKLVSFDGLVRYINETNPMLLAATEKEIRKHLPNDLPKLMTLNKFHFQSVYQKDTLPSNQETYRLIAKIITYRDTLLWRPKQKPNNDWRNWNSGNL
jgi:hypothetical protein